MDVYTAHVTVADMDGTPLESAFDGVPGDTLVVQAFDQESGALVALARSKGQTPEDLERETRFQLARTVHRTAQQVANNPADPRYEL